MATKAEIPAGEPQRPHKRRARSAFPAAIPFAIIALIGTLIGFFPTFFSRLGEVDAVHQVHGWVMTGWLVLVLTQALLVRSRQYRLHRILGWSSTVLFAVMFVTSWQMIVIMLSGETGLPFEMAKFFAYTDLVDLPLLLILFGGAIALRKDRYLHSRLIAATLLTSIVPALARMYNIFIWRSMEGLFHAMHPTYITILVMLAAAIYADWKRGHLRWPLPFTFAWFVFDYATLWPVWRAEWYDTLARSIAAMA